MAQHLNNVGLSLSSSKLQLVEVVKESSQYFLENVDEHIFESVIDFNSDKNQIIHILQNSINLLISKNTLRSTLCSITLPFNLFSFFIIPVESMLNESELDEHIKWEYSILFPNKNFADEIIRTIKFTDNTNQSKCMVIGLDRVFVKSLYELLKKNNLKLKFVDLPFFASHLLVGNNFKKTLSIYIDELYISLFSYNDNEFSGGSVLKRGDLDDEDLITKFIEKNNIAFDNYYLSGNFDLEEIKSKLGNIINVEIASVNPFDNIPTSSTFIQNAYYLNRPNSFSAAAGICFRKN